MNASGRRAFLKRLARLAATPALCAGGAFGYGSLLERHRVRVESHDLPLALGEAAPAHLRAVAMGDFHYDPLHEAEYAARCVGLVNELSPDVVFLTGDFVTASSRRVGEFAEVLAGLRPRHGIFACLGNHDHWSNPARVAGALGSAGVEVLMNRHTRIRCGGGELVVAGLQSVWGGAPDWRGAFSGLRREERAVVLIHEPDFAQWLSEDPRAAFQVSGHTHGGQVRVPLFGALRLPTWGRLFQAGFYRRNSLRIHVNRGIGTVGHHVRFFCPPEIACFDLRNTGAAQA